MADSHRRNSKPNNVVAVDLSNVGIDPVYLDIDGEKMTGTVVNAAGVPMPYVLVRE